MSGRQQAQQKLRDLFELYCREPDLLPEKFHQRIDHVGLPRAVVDYLAGMTDQYCLLKSAERD